MELLQIDGPEQSLVQEDLADAGLPPAVGVQSFGVFRASQAAADKTDKKGWTYHHHMDMACWRGRLYVGWNSCEKDEDIWPARELYSSSLDGVHWTDPAEMFPQGSSTCLRMYFYRTANGRMLLIAGLRTSTEKTEEGLKGGLVVRELDANHHLQPVYTLQLPPLPVENHPPKFETSPDSGFVEACKLLLNDKPYLEQQDLGRLLGTRRMKWHSPENWPGGVIPATGASRWIFGKAFSFYRRAGNQFVGISKMGYTVLSDDDGENWTAPTVPPTLVTGKAKVWSQKTADGRFALVYNPSAKRRYPLIVVSGDDGVTFGDMRIVQGELPIQRYPGADRSVGPQYVRGISTWATDGSRDDNAMWLVYSMSKEDIWVTRVPLPIQADEDGDVADDFDAMPLGPIIAKWTTYSPKWAAVTIATNPQGMGRCLRLEDSDPYDYARAMRVFKQTAHATAECEILIPSGQEGSDPIEIELLSKFGSKRPVRWSFAANGEMRATIAGEWQSVGKFATAAWLRLGIDVDTQAGIFTLRLDDRVVVDRAPVAEAASDVQRISFRTGSYRNVGGKAPVDPPTDIPEDNLQVFIRNVRVSALA